MAVNHLPFDSQEASMRRVLPVVLFLAFVFGLSPHLIAQGAPPQASADQPYSVEYYYKVQWGHQQEFLDLFLKNHYPLLKKIQSTGRMLVDQNRIARISHDGRWSMGLSRDNHI